MSVDDRIVAMKFDNESFERKLSETIRSLDKLRASLDFSRAKSNLADLSSAGRKFNMEGMGHSIDGISNKFLAMATIGITALSNLTNRAVDAGISMAKAFTIGPIIDGFKEMETNMNSIQTILANTASKGTTLDDVNAALQLLNEYSDKTIYNFGQMAKNIGAFTAAGVDLDTSVDSIKGIANLSALSGASAEDASRAMYQLSQAISSGTLRLMDWRSVENANIGGEIFKNQLLQTASALGTITEIPFDMTVKEWEKANGSFRESLEKGWITSEVLTTALGTFTGDLTDAELAAKGFTDAQIANIQKLAKIAVASATEVKTFSQLIGTVKESIATGFADSFKIVLGGFNEAKALFTEINNAIGSVVSRSADYRNNLLAAWKFFGGRDKAIQAFKDALAGIGTILKPIREAFREIFPRKTAVDLLRFTDSFANFAKNLKIGAFTADKVKKVFKGFFSVLEIGFEIFKGIGSLIRTVTFAILGASHGLFDFASASSGSLEKLNEALVAGGGIKDFFDRIGDTIKKAIEPLHDFIHAVVDFFEAFDEKKSDAAQKGIDKIGDRFSFVGAIVDRLSDIFGQIMEILDVAWEALSSWFGELGEKLVDELVPGDFDKAVDLVNVGLLGGILLMLKRFVDGGLKINLGGGVLEKINGTLTGLTKSLQALEANVKANALLKIAAALAILTASVVVLSLIDSDKLAAALTATTAGFGQLIGTFTILTKLSTTAFAIKFGLVAAGMLILAAAILVLSIAVKQMANLEMIDMAKGIGAVGASMIILVKGMNALSADMRGMVRAGIGMIGIALALLILSQAVEQFGKLDWEELGKGLGGIAVGLGALVLAMNKMPVKGMIQAGVGIGAIAVALLILSQATQEFAEMSWEELAKGLGAVVIALAAIVLLTNTMPAGSLIAAGAGLVLVSLALVVMAKAVKMLADLKLTDLLKGIAGIAALLIILGVAAYAMEGAGPGAGAIVIMAGALYILTGVLERLGKIPITQLITGLVAIAAVLTVLGLAALIMQPIIPSLLGLGVAMAAVGAGFALFGAAVYLVAKGLELLARSGKKGIDAVIAIGKKLVAAIPALIGAIIASVINSVTEIVEALPLLVKALKVLIGHILDTFTELAPKFADTIGAIMQATFEIIGGLVPQLIELGFTILDALLTGIRENIGKLTDTATDIMINFARALQKKAPLLVDAAVDLILTFLKAIAGRAADIAASGLLVLTTFLKGMADNIGNVIDTVTMIIISFVQGIADNLLLIVDAGYQILINLLLGITENILDVAAAVTDVITSFITAIGDNALAIIGAGASMLASLLYGIAATIQTVADAVGTIVTTFITAVADNAQDIIDAGVAALVSFITGLGENLEDVIDAGTEVIVKFIEGLGAAGEQIVNAAFRTLLKFLKALDEAIVRYTPQLQEVGKSIAGHILDGLTFGLAGKASGFLSGITDLAKDAKNGFMKEIDAQSPSKDFYKIAGSIVDGLTLRMDKDTSVEDASAGLASRAIVGFTKTLGGFPSILEGIDLDASPVITPVLDLTRVQQEAKGLNGLFGSRAIAPVVSINGARTISATAEVPGSTDPGAQVIEQNNHFEQNNYSPEALSTNDIYRNTKSQIALAKEELQIA